MQVIPAAPFFEPEGHNRSLCCSGAPPSLVRLGAVGIPSFFRLQRFTEFEVPSFGIQFWLLGLVSWLSSSSPMPRTQEAQDTTN